MKRWITMLLSACMTLNLCTTVLAADETQTAPLLLHYEMTEQGDNVADAKGDYDGELAGSTEWVKGINGYGVKLSGGNGYIKVPGEAFTQSEDVSFSMWVKPDKVENWTSLLVAGKDSNNYAVLAAKGTPSGNSVGLTMAIKNGGTEYRIAAKDGTTLPPHEWSLVTYTQKGTQASLFLNGETVAEKNDMGASIKGVLDAAQDADVRIGYNQIFSDPGLAGTIAEVKIYGGVIDAAEDKKAVEDKKEVIAELKVEETAEALDLGDLSDVTEDLKLETKLENGISIAWTSDNPEFITSDGKVTIPTIKQGDQTVTLTAVFGSDETQRTVTKTYEVTLLAMTEERIVEKAADYVRRYVDYIINDGYELLTDEIQGCEIEWTLTDGEAEISEGKVIKTEESKERQPIKLKAVLSKGQIMEEVTFEHVTLIDEYAGYILSFFGGEDGEQKLHLGYSYDGINWEKLNDGNTVVWTQNGNGNVRDPYIWRKKDGSFAVVATQGWDTPQIYLWDSEDLVQYDNERLKTVTDNRVAGLTGSRAWAPEASYDPLKDEYMVYWSDPYANGNNGCTYANTSKDLEEFSDPFVLFDAGYQIIDANIIKWKGSYYMVFKDERGNNEDGGGGKHILMAKSDSLEPGTFKQYTGPITDTLVEGPFMFKVNGEETWYHYYDYFKEHKFGVSVTHDLLGGEWDFLGKSETMPTENVQHGGVIAVTQKELDRILEGYDITETITKIEDPQEVKAEKGTSFENLALPQKVEVTVKAGKIMAPVIWEDASDYNSKEEGTYTITGTVTGGYEFADGVSPIVKVTVEVIDPTVLIDKITVSPSVKELTVGQSFQLTAGMEPSNATNKEVSITSNNGAVAGVSGNQITAMGAGSAVITVTAKDGSGVSASMHVTVRLAETSKVTVTQLLDQCQVQVTFENVNGAKEYEVYRSTTESSGFEKVGTTTETTYTDKNAKAGKTYYYRVLAKGTQAAYNSVLSQTCANILVLARPKVKVKQTKAGEGNVSWKKVKGASGYEIIISAKKSKNFKRAAMIKKASVLKKNVKVSKSWKKVYVKVRPYRLVNGQKVWGTYSKAVSYTVKK